MIQLRNFLQNQKFVFFFFFHFLIMAYSFFYKQLGTGLSPQVPFMFA